MPSDTCISAPLILPGSSCTTSEGPSNAASCRASKSETLVSSKYNDSAHGKKSKSPIWETFGCAYRDQLDKNHFPNIEQSRMISSISEKSIVRFGQIGAEHGEALQQNEINLVSVGTFAARFDSR